MILDRIDLLQDRRTFGFIAQKFGLIVCLHLLDRSGHTNEEGHGCCPQARTN